MEQNLRKSYSYFLLFMVHIWATGNSHTIFTQINIWSEIKLLCQLNASSSAHEIYGDTC